jgi:uncharacterized protein YacL
MMSKTENAGTVVGSIVGAIIGGIILVVITALIAALPTYLLWNWLMPVIFNLPVITFWQALGINILCEILFKSNSSKEKE